MEPEAGQPGFRVSRSEAVKEDDGRKEVILVTEGGRDRVGKEAGKDSFIPTLLLTSSFPASALTPPPLV